MSIYLDLFFFYFVVWINLEREDYFLFYIIYIIVDIVILVDYKNKYLSKGYIFLFFNIF